MTDQGASKEVSQFITVNSLKEIADPFKKYLKKGKKRELKFRAKVNNVQSGAGQLVDSTGLINFVLEGATVVQGQTYELTGSLRVVNYKLTIAVTTATASAEPITATGNEHFSSAQIDGNSGKPIINIGQLLSNRIGQSFFAKPLNIVPEQKRVKATLADSTGAVDVEISIENKRITQEVLNSLTSEKIYLFSDMVINFSKEQKLVGRFNYRSTIQEVNDHPINNLSNNNISQKEYNEEEQKALVQVLQINENKEHPKQKSNRRNNKNVGEKKVQKRNITPTEPITVSQLVQWNNNQTFVGKILSLNVESKTLKSNDNDTEPTQKNYLKGTVADHTGVIDFDMAEKKDEPHFAVGDYVQFNMAMNKGRNTHNGETIKVGGHYVEVKKFGSYVIVAAPANTDINTTNNLSALELAPRPKNENRINKRRNNNNNRSDSKGPKQNNNRNRSSSPNNQRTNSKNNRNNNYDNHNNNRRRDNNNDNNSNNKRVNNREQTNQVNKDNQGTFNNKKSYPNGGQRYNNRDNRENRDNNSQHRENNNNNRDNNNRENRHPNNRDNNNNRQNNNNNNNNSQNRDNKEVRVNNNYKGNNNNNYNNNNNSRNNNNNRDNNNNTNNRHQGYENRNQQSAPRPQKQHVQTDIINLKPGERGSDFTGYVYEVQEFSKEINEKTLYFIKGRVADEKANIKFDIKKPRNLTVEEGKTYHFQNINNKVSDDGFHYVDLLRFGKLVPSNTEIKNPNTSINNEADRSGIEYVKKTISN